MCWDIVMHQRATHEAARKWEATSVEVKQHIRNALSVPRPITERLVNYKKNGSPYTCRVQITPLFNVSGKLAHFIALERELQNEA